MSDSLVDLEILSSQDVVGLSLSPDTLQAMESLSEDASKVVDALDEVKTLPDHFSRSLLHNGSISIEASVAVNASWTSAPALTTRSSDAVIADLKRATQQRRPEFGSEDVEPGVESAQIQSNNYSIPLDTLDEEIEIEGSGDEEEVIVPGNPRKISDRKRAQNAAFDSYFQSYAKQQAKAPSALGNIDSESQSTRWLVKQAESNQIISTPREYQIELFERAKEQNIIAVLDTGSGKTLIAVLLLRHMLEQELEDRALGKPKRIAFFLVDSVQLIFQQFAVLECNLNQPMDRLYGQMSCNLQDKQYWENIYSENMVIVCTAEILRSALHHSLITIYQINLLIFDEAHHAKKDHPYARIIKDFYALEPDKCRLPKIFGMTASPVDTRDNVHKAAAELETILHCQIATASDPALLQFANKKQTDQIAKYDPLRPSFETSLYRQMNELLGNNVIFAKLFRYAKEATSELGAWCADHLWMFSFSVEEIRKLEAKTERKFISQIIARPLHAFESQISNLQEARRIIDAHEFHKPQPSSDHLSSKVMKLAKYLQERFERATDDKCIVFVRQRYTARLLFQLFSRENIGTPHLRVGILVGGAQTEVGDMKASFRQQVLTLTRFRKGQVNCLFSTSVAEEGLDVPECNLVIRFDLYSTLIQYIQSRGRARQLNSRYIHMIEDGNRAHAALIREVFTNEGILRQFCQALPADRLLLGNDFDMETILGNEKSHRVYKEPSTGAKLTYKSSLMVLAKFVGSLAHSADISLNPEYVMTSQNRQYICEVILPDTSPIRGAIGRPATTKQVAKCSAAFEICLLLRQGRYLDANLLSTFAKQLPVMRNAHLAVNSKKQAAYKMRTKPQIWTAHEVPHVLYLTVFTLADPGSLLRPSQPIGLLTRAALPDIPEIPLFFGPGRKSHVISTGITTSLQVDVEILEKINCFTMRVFQDVFSKEYKTDLTTMPYFLVPIKEFPAEMVTMSPAPLVDWEILAQVQMHDQLLWDDSTPESFFADRYIVDLHDGSRKLWAYKVTHEYKPLDPVPPNTAPRPAARKNNDNIMEYSCSLWAKSRARRNFKETQPVIEAEYIPLRRNLLDESEFIQSAAPTKCFIIPEPLKISSIPTTVVAMAYLLPSIIFRVESVLIALEACTMLHLNVYPALALEAMTKDSHNVEELGEEQLTIQRGMGNNYERLEFLGDCFLKMATTISLYTQHPTSDEFQYHVKRMLMVCNQNLLTIAQNLKLFEFIRSQGLTRRSWYPEGLVLQKGKTATAPDSHNLGDKTIADVSEALIGAALLSNHGKNNLDNAVRAVTELVCSTDHTMTCYADYYKAYKKPPYQTAATTASQRNLAMQVQSKHDYEFKYPRVLRSAFMHPSYPFSYERVPSYQRLEFLGDSLLDMACINFLFHRFPNRDPQWLTEHKMAMVSNQFLGALCISLGFHKHLLQVSAPLQKQILEYLIEIDEARLEAEEEAVKAGKDKHDRSPDFWVHSKAPPKCLPDMIEAYVGAIFVDSEYNYAEVERFFEKHIQPYFENMDLYDTFANKHPVTFLTNIINQHMGCSNWNIYARQLADIGDGMPPQVMATVIIHKQIVADHQGSSGRYAKLSVAKKALEILTGLPLQEFRATYNCDCKVADGDDGDTASQEQMSPGTAI